MIGGEYLDNKGILKKTDRKNTGRFATISNTLTPDVGLATRLIGGYITSGVLKGYGFNPDGSLRTPDIGTVVGTNMVGGEGPSDDERSPLITPQQRYTLMAKTSFELTDTLKLSADLRYSRYYNSYTWFGDHTGSVTIKSDNAFLNDDIRQMLADADQGSFTMARYNADLSYSTINLDRRSIQGTLALDGSFGDGRWRYGAYYSHGQYRNKINTPGFLITQNFNNAVDAVIDPATGEAVCRSGAAGCVPIDLFGEGAPSQEAIDYVTGTPRLNSLNKIDTYGVSLRGEPFDLPAGPVSIAIGAEGRNLSTVSKVGELDAAKAFTSFWFNSLRGEVRRQGSLRRSGGAGDPRRARTAQAGTERRRARIGLQHQRHGMVVETGRHQRIPARRDRPRHPLARHPRTQRQRTLHEPDGQQRQHRRSALHR